MTFGTQEKPRKRLDKELPIATPQEMQVDTVCKDNVATDGDLQMQLSGRPFGPGQPEMLVDALQLLQR
ncbi:hypothetical protein MKX07_003863 [Trichoderma sp. CBMAI-0711]|nr:hypothetical protein MKX07_003863 [Trichoderma sp. CBMAI-0711]